ncbi:MAG: DUF1566 domain-containing protein [Proteobacteria bacterium]|nr:DUF1566 domain-containing protein [Pseudomonadota bacterium]
MSACTLKAACLAVVIATGSASSAAPARLADTGVDFCSDGQSQVIACGSTGQDAESGLDVTRPGDANGRLGLRYTRLCNSGEPAGQGHCPAAPAAGNARDEWGCTRDEVTGLVWETKTSDGGRRDGTRGYTYYTPGYDPEGQYGGPHDATGYVHAVNALGLCGQHDWRLPTPAELLTIVDMGITTLPTVDPRFLPNTAANLYWADGTVFRNPFADELAWGADFAFGSGAISAQFRSDQRPVRLVHGAPVAQRFRALPDDPQEVRDALGLVWRRCVEGMTFDGTTCTGTPLALGWTDALAHVQQEAAAAGIAWRLPNAKELGSLLDHTRPGHIDPRAFPGQPADAQWTSSPIPTYLLPRCVFFPDGVTSICNATTMLAMRLVRDR